MFLWFENHSVFTLKPNVIATMNGVPNTKRSATLIGKNKVETGETSTGAQPSSSNLIQASSQRASSGDGSQMANPSAASAGNNQVAKPTRT